VTNSEAKQKAWRGQRTETSLDVNWAMQAKKEEETREQWGTDHTVFPRGTAKIRTKKNQGSPLVNPPSGKEGGFKRTDKWSSIRRRRKSGGGFNGERRGGRGEKLTNSFAGGQEKKKKKDRKEPRDQAPWVSTSAPSILPQHKKRDATKKKRGNVGAEGRRLRTSGLLYCQGTKKEKQYIAVGREMVTYLPENPNIPRTNVPLL